MKHAFHNIATCSYKHGELKTWVQNNLIIDVLRVLNCSDFAIVAFSIELIGLSPDTTSGESGRDGVLLDDGGGESDAVSSAVVLDEGGSEGGPFVDVGAE